MADHSSDPALDAVDEAEALRLLEAINVLLDSVVDETLRDILEETCCDLAELLPAESEADEFDDESDDLELAA